MENKFRPYMIIMPKPFVIIASDENLLCYVMTKEVEKRYGRYYSQRNKVPLFHLLSFTDGMQDKAVQRVEDTDLLRLSGKALMQLIMFEARKNNDELDDVERSLRKFFPDPAALGRACDYICDIGKPLFDRTPLPEISDHWHRFVVSAEREKRGEFWKPLGDPYRPA